MTRVQALYLQCLKNEGKEWEGAGMRDTGTEDVLEFQVEK